MSTDPLPPACVPCRPGARALTPADVAARLPHVPHWTVAEQRLRRSFELADFRAALAWVNRIGMLAEEQDHHPDLHLTGWNKLEVVLWTHAIGGLHDNDFVLACKIDELWERQRS